MTIEWFRDLVIVIFGIMAIGALTFFLVTGYSLYKRVNQALESFQDAMAALKELSLCFSEPLSQPSNIITSLFEGVRQGIDSISKVLQRES